MLPEIKTAIDIVKKRVSDAMDANDIITAVDNLELNANLHGYDMYEDRQISIRDRYYLARHIIAVEELKGGELEC